MAKFRLSRSAPTTAFIAIQSKSCRHSTQRDREETESGLKIERASEEGSSPADPNTGWIPGGKGQPAIPGLLNRRASVHRPLEDLICVPLGLFPFLVLFMAISMNPLVSGGIHPDSNIHIVLICFDDLATLLAWVDLRHCFRSPQTLACRSSSTDHSGSVTPAAINFENAQHCDIRHRARAESRA
jgi:hypothetical protein